MKAPEILYRIHCRYAFRAVVCQSAVSPGSLQKDCKPFVHKGFGSLSVLNEFFPKYSNMNASNSSYKDFLKILCVTEKMS